MTPLYLSLTIPRLSEYDLLRVYALEKFSEQGVEARTLIFEAGLRHYWEGYRRNPKHRTQIETWEKEHLA